MLLGFVGLTLSVLVVVSLLLSNVDKVTNSDANSGYVLKQATLPNPIDYILLECQKVNPLLFSIRVTSVPESKQRPAEYSVSCRVLLS